MTAGFWFPPNTGLGKTRNTGYRSSAICDRDSLPGTVPRARTTEEPTLWHKPGTPLGPPELEAPRLGQLRALRECEQYPASSLTILSGGSEMIDFALVFAPLQDPLSS